MFNHHDISRNAFMLRGPLAHRGYDWWWHSFSAQDTETGEDKPFFIEFFTCNPALAEDTSVLGQTAENKAAGSWVYSGMKARNMTLISPNCICTSKQISLLKNRMNWFAGMYDRKISMPSWKRKSSAKRRTCSL